MSVYVVQVATVGENFKRIRKQKQITQEAIYEALGFKRVSNVSLLETSKRLPQPRTIQKMATVLGCEPWELLEDVETPWDELRARRHAPRKLESTKAARTRKAPMKKRRVVEELPREAAQKKGR